MHRRQPRDIPRVWEIDYAHHDPGKSGWSSYAWALGQAEELGVDLCIVASLYKSFGSLGAALGQDRASWLVGGSHEYREGRVRVRGLTLRRSISMPGVVLLCWAKDQSLAQVEAGGAKAVAAVADWGDDIRAWRGLHQPRRIGRTDEELEAEHDGQPGPGPLPPRAAAAIRSAGALVNEHHSVLSTFERERVAGALVALRQAGVEFDPEALRGFLMGESWSGSLIDQVEKLAERVKRGETPKHAPFGPV